MIVASLDLVWQYGNKVPHHDQQINKNIKDFVDFRKKFSGKNINYCIALA